MAKKGRNCAEIAESTRFRVVLRAGIGENSRSFLLLSGPTFHLLCTSGGHVAFEIGDKVIYPNHGLGVIERIETKTIMGTTCGFYQLRMANETTVFVPVDNVEGVG